MFTVQSLHTTKQKPFIDKISLKLLLDYYDTYLAPYEYTYELTDGQTERTIRLHFDPHRLCHLLGVETVAKAKYSRSVRKRAEYKGHEGYRRIKDGRIDFDHLKNLSKGAKTAFKNIKDKLIFFYLVPYVMESTEIMVKFEQVENSDIQCEILIFDFHHNTIVHVGIEKENQTDYYFPRTFLVERITDTKNGKKFIQGQDKIYVNTITKTNRSSGKVLQTIVVKQREEDTQTEIETSASSEKKNK
ncbi:PBECR4 domain-containing protein [Photobacterium sp. SP02]|jgi:hypothetical protein|uniref:PBECR4 domain-containing protein n=1 Tax=Photobacterium sp. SP02 TaxID=3032280 RepID=UPI003145536B